MNMLDMIRQKRDGGQLSKEEIIFWLTGYVGGKIPDYQTSALLMAIYWRGLDHRETVDLTLAMRDSGEVLDLSAIAGLKADKHSTGGVGDKTTLIVAPLLAAAGLKVAKMSGRGLGFTGGTLDKLESIPGFRTSLPPQEFKEHVNTHGLAVIGQTAELAPADKLLYALRDATATVESSPLIAASIMSKKLAVGADVLVLDVKYGSGAFFKTQAAAYDAARLMVEIGRAAGQRVAALLTSMEQPLGRAVGNALEVREAWQTLCGQGPEDLVALSLSLAAEELLLAGMAPSHPEGLALATELLDTGTARRKFVELVEAQGGDSDFSHLPISPLQTPFVATQSGYICALDAELCGRAALVLGAGRAIKEADIDHAAGLLLEHKIGDPVQAGETIAVLHSQTERQTAEAAVLLAQAVVIGLDPPPALSLIDRIV